MASAFAILAAGGEAAAAPGQRGIAIDAAQTSCGWYTEGDECTAYTLPAGWTAYFPDAATGDAVTPYGSCPNAAFDTRACCEALGLTFVEDIGATEVTRPCPGCACEQQEPASGSSGCAVAPRARRVPLSLLGIAALLLVWRSRTRHRARR